MIELTSTFYGNNRKIIKGFSEFLEYYEEKRENFENRVYWEKSVRDDHISVSMISPSLKYDIRNMLGYIEIINNDSYEYSLNLSDETWRRVAEIKSIKINGVTVDDLKNFELPFSEESFFGYHFSVKGHLENIKEIKNIPDSLNNIVSGDFLKPNRDKYLIATLTDNTGSVDVFLQMTSLNKKELNKDRNHSVVIFNYEDSLVIIVRFSTLVDVLGDGSF